MAALTSLRPSSGADRAYVEHVYFETQRWIIEALFGWRGDDVERAKFAEFYDESNSTIIVMDGKDAGWMTVIRRPDHIEFASIYIQADRQRNGIGTALIRNVMRDAEFLERIDRRYEAFERDVSPTIADECRALLAVLVPRQSFWTALDAVSDYSSK